MSEMTPDEFWKILHAPVEVKLIFYRLYYNDDGSPICFSMEELPHNYIEIDAATYHQTPANIRVVNGKIVVINPASYVKKLTPSTDGISCDPRDICIVVAEDQLHTNWSLKTNETS